MGVLRFVRRLNCCSCGERKVKSRLESFKTLVELIFSSLCWRILFLNPQKKNEKRTLQFACSNKKNWRRHSVHKVRTPIVLLLSLNRSISSSSSLKMSQSAIKRFTQECQFGKSVLKNYPANWHANCFYVYKQEHSRVRQAATKSCRRKTTDDEKYRKSSNGSSRTLRWD